MTLPSVVTPEEWLAARRQLLDTEKELTRARDRLSRQRRELPMVRVDKPYAFVGPAGPVPLSALFDGRAQLILYHFMFDPEWIDGCPRCTRFVNDLGDIEQLRAKDTELALVSRARFDTIEDYRRRMGWTVPWYSTFGSDFNYDFHVTMDPAVAPVEYNFRSASEHEDAGMPWYTSGEQPGITVFLRNGDAVHQTYAAFARGLDALAFARNFLDLTPLGRQEG